MPSEKLGGKNASKWYFSKVLYLAVHFKLNVSGFLWRAFPIIKHVFFKNIYIEMFLLETIKIMVYATVTSELVNLLICAALHRYRRGQGSNPGKPDFFRLSFRNCISCVNNCEDLLYIYFFIPQFKYMNFMYS